MARPKKAGLKARNNVGRSFSTSSSGSGCRAVSAQSFIIWSVPTFEVMMITVFLKSISRPSASSSNPLSNTW